MGCNVQGEIPAPSLLYHLFIHYNLFSECLTRVLSSVPQVLYLGVPAPLPPKFWSPPKGYFMAFQMAWNNGDRFRFRLNLFTVWSCGETEWHKVSFVRERYDMCCDLQRDDSEVLWLEGAWETWQLHWLVLGIDSLLYLIMLVTVIAMWTWRCWIKSAAVFSRPKQLPVFLV